uniref:Uncharacterized protein n=1 Tax=Sparus aurata TaxID=8175 RepID=A0A671UVD2_SPAAU
MIQGSENSLDNFGNSFQTLKTIAASKVSPPPPQELQTRSPISSRPPPTPYSESPKLSSNLRVLKEGISVLETGRRQPFTERNTQENDRGAGIGPPLQPNTVPAPGDPAVPAPGEPAVPAPGDPAVPAPGDPAVPAPGDPAVPAPEDPIVLAPGDPTVPAPGDPTVPIPRDSG